MKLTDVIRRKAVSGELKGETDDTPGHLKAVFSTFDVEDRDGDIIRKSALTNGQEIPLVWHHQWERPVGKGIIRVQEDRAIFDGYFFMDTIEGQEAYKTVKNMGALQQYSWGFQVLEAEAKNEEDEDDPFWWLYGMDITKAEAFEVSPVLVGANRGTSTLSVKGMDDLARSMRFSDQRDMAHAAIASYIKRAQSLAETRTEEGRNLSAKSIERFVEDLGILKNFVGAIEALIPVSEPEVVEQAETVEAAARLRRLRLSQHRVPVLIGD